MKTKKNSTGLARAAEEEPNTDVPGLWLGVGDGNLETRIKKAFELAKSAGRELDLIFSSGGPAHDALGRLRVRYRRTVEHLILAIPVRR